MIQSESVINVCDNSGALKARCIHVYGGSGKQKYASVGDIVMVSTIKVSPNGKIKKGEKLHYYDKVCDHLYFSWSDGLWFIKTTEGISISCGLEEFYRNKK